jgi:site-specific DNA-methyltransferase (adenine-specific)/adenine-specific DNA-methyltransferase
MLRGIHKNGENTSYPTQKPEQLLERITLSLSNPGDIVLDCFAGSGTTCAIAEKLGRRWIGIDSGKLAIYTIQKRMLQLKTEIGQKGQPLEPKPFTLYNAGLYDFSTLSKLPWESWRFFALQLFECKDIPHTIGGLKLDGKRKGASVLVFNHLEHPDVRIDEDTVHDIHIALGNKIGSRFYIIAPRRVFDFQQDYITFDNVRYYALRIPYSYIDELHHRDFTALQQPNDETAVNDPLDAVGFDFIRPPQVVWQIGIEKRRGKSPGRGYLKIEQFESRAYLRGTDTRGGLETLSMLMLDYDYDDELFNPDAFFYAHQLEAAKWMARFPTQTIGEKMMVVFIDIYGNEAREVIDRQKVGL